MCSHVLWAAHSPCAPPPSIASVRPFRAGFFTGKTRSNSLDAAANPACLHRARRLTGTTPAAARPSAAQLCSALHGSGQPLPSSCWAELGSAGRSAGQTMLRYYARAPGRERACSGRSATPAGAGCPGKSTGRLAAPPACRRGGRGDLGMAGWGGGPVASRPAPASSSPAPAIPAGGRGRKSVALPPRRAAPACRLPPVRYPPVPTRQHLPAQSRAALGRAGQTMPRAGLGRRCPGLSRAGLNANRFHQADANLVRVDWSVGLLAAVLREYGAEGRCGDAAAANGEVSVWGLRVLRLV
jgi:hypothetical protein